MERAMKTIRVAVANGILSAEKAHALVGCLDRGELSPEGVRHALERLLARHRRAG
jgi:hypothetical protein